MSYIEIKNLNFSYKDDDGNPESVLRDLTLNIEKGEYVAILGHNGSGKSTLAKLLNLVIDDYDYFEGSIVIDGIEISSPDMTEDDVYELRKKVGMVFQNPDNQIVATIVEEDVAFGPENLGLPREEIRKRVDEALSAVGMTEYSRHEPHRLSGGQKQRVAIAGIIAMKPECIVLDEPTAMLDPRGRREVMKTVKMLNEEFGITVIFITHYMDEAVKAKRVIVMDEGRIILDGTPRNVFTHIDELKRVGLDVPEATELATVLVEEGIGIIKDALDIDELFESIVNLMEDKN